MKDSRSEKSIVNVYNLIILDESGSMQSICSQAIGGINATLDSIRSNEEKHPEQHHFVTIVTFEGDGPKGVKVRRDRVPVGKVRNFTESDYCPGSCTPLHDAVGISVSNLEKNTEEGSRVFVTIITDGYENSSEEYSGSAIRNLVSRKRECGWTFAYIGATEDAVEVAHELNIHNALEFDASEVGVAEMIIKYRKANEKFADMLECESSSPVLNSELFEDSED